MPRIRLEAAAIATAAGQLGAGSAHYTPRQLYYASCAAAEAPRARISSGAMGMGALVILVGLTLIRLSHVATGILVAVGVLFLLMGLRMRAVEHVRSLSRALVVSYDDFHSRLLPEVAPELLTGLVRDRDQLTALNAGAADAPLVVCDTAENVLLVAAVVADRGLGYRVTTQAQLGATPPPLVLVVHDCSPHGCALGSELRDAGIAEVVDVALRPRDLLVDWFQVIEGAPARLPRDLGSVLAPEEISWLLSGKRLELAAYPPELLGGRLRAAIQGSPELTGGDPAAAAAADVADGHQAGPRS